MVSRRDAITLRLLSLYSLEREGEEMKPSLVYRFIKRCFDILSSGLALIVLIPMWIIAVVGILISDPGPVFYLSNRVGKENKIFGMIKFRSMRVDKNANEKSLRPDQDRIFPWGRVLRKTKIDELPQLLNVFFHTLTAA